jgi:prefoldin subunit 5
MDGRNLEIEIRDKYDELEQLQSKVDDLQDEIDALEMLQDEEEDHG